MKERDLKNKLSQIKCYPDLKWKIEHKELLVAQITGTSRPPQKAGGFFNGLKALVLARRFRLKPAWSVLLIITTVFVGGALSLRAARDSRPGEALYIAKRISEQTQLALTFNEKQRAKLGIEFASKRAQELNQVLQEEKSPNEREKHVEQLTQDFKKQIIVAKKNLEKISGSKNIDKQAQLSDNSKQKNNNQKAKDSQLDQDSDNINNDNSNDNNDNNKIFSANLGKDSRRIEIAEKNKKLQQDKISSSSQTNSQAKQEKNATSTQQHANKESAEESGTVDLEQVNKILAEAQQLIEKDDIQATVDKLEQANEIIDQIEPDNGQVKGVEEPAVNNATSSEDIKTEIEAEDSNGQQTASTTK